MNKTKKMKTKKITQLFFSVAFILSNLLFIGEIAAQTALQSEEAYKKAHADDAKYLKGFDEKAIVTELKKKGIPETEWKGVIRGRKQRYINQQKGLVVKRTFSNPSPVRGLRAPSAGCPNANFEDTTFTGWNAGTGNCSNYPAATSWTLGFVSGPINDVNTDGASQQDLLDDPNGFDPVAAKTAGIANIPYIAPGGGHVSARLGNADVNCGTEYLDYPILVTPTNTSFTYQYAVVLEDAAGHSATEQPRFTISVYNASGTIVSGPCAAYAVDGLNAANDPTYIPFYVTSTYGGGSSSIYGGGGFSSGPVTTLDGYYKKWTTVSIDLTAYIGNTMTIHFVTQDCTLGAHYGYAYIDAGCSQLTTTVLFCPSDTVCQVVAPPGFVSYQWYTSPGGVAIPGATGETLTVSHPYLGEAFTVAMLTSVAGCGSTLSTVLAYSNMTTYQNHQDVNSCNGTLNGWAYVNQSGVPGPFTYTWIDSATNANVTQAAHPDSITHVGGGTYYATVQSHSGCTATDTIHIIQPPTPLPLTHAGIPICPAAATATLTAPPGSAYQWYNPANTAIPAATNSTYVATNPAVGQTYSVHYSLPSGCPSVVVDSFYNINVNAPSHVGVAICPNAASATLTAPAGSGYQWYNPAGTPIAGAVASTCTATSPAVGQTYSVSYTPTGVTCQMVVVDSFYNINGSVPPHVGVPICPATATVTLTAPAGSAYQWYNPANTAIAGATNSTYVAQNPTLGQNYTVYYTAAGGGCQVAVVDTFYYLHFNLQAQTLVNPTCNASNGQSSVTVIGGTPPYAYSWLPAGGNASTASGLSAGTYTINVTDVLGCTSTVNDTVTNTNGLQASISTTPITCHNGSDGTATASPIGGVGPFTYLWGNGDTISTITNIHAGNYCVTVKAANGCSASTCATLANPPKTIASFYGQPVETDINSPNITFTNTTADTTCNWFWNFGDNVTSSDQDPTHTYNNIGSFPVMLVAINSKGCKDTVFHTIIIDGLFTFYAPNAFTPENMSNDNTVFLPKGTGWDNTTFKLQIFDRWGNFLFYSDDVTKGWDGKVKGSLVLLDVYVWKATVNELTSGKEHDYIGKVTVVR